MTVEGDPFDLWAILYADDAGHGFDSREELGRGARLLNTHLRRFGLEMHCGLANEDGTVRQGSKSEAVYFPPAGTIASDADVAPLPVDDHRGIVTFTDRFRYLGSILTSSLTDEVDVGARIASAGAALAQLTRSVFRADFGNRSVPLLSKGRIYTSLVLGILLYGCESWVLTTVLRNKLKAFHNRCVRAMCGVTRRRVQDIASGHESLYARLGVPCVLRLISNRKLRWAGHVARMDIRSRLPRKLLSSWVPGVPRPRGRAYFYGHDLTRELNGIGFNLDDGAVQIGVSRDWMKTAQDRSEWRTLVEPLRMPAKPVSSQSSDSADSQPPNPREVVDAPRVSDGDGSLLTDATWAARLRHRVR